MLNQFKPENLANFGAIINYEEGVVENKTNALLQYFMTLLTTFSFRCNDMKYNFDKLPNNFVISPSIHCCPISTTTATT